MTLMDAPAKQRGVAEWPVWTTTARLVTTDPAAAGPARRLVEDRLDAVDRAASRFRHDSEVVRVAAAAGRPVSVSPLLAELVTVALRAAAETGGAVDPTLGGHLAALGYDRDLGDCDQSPGVATRSPRPLTSRFCVVRRPSWHDVHLEGCELRVPAGVVLDLGATAKAWAADHCAELVAERLGGGVLVSLGGDLSVAGDDPVGGWTILVQDGPMEPTSLVTLDGARGLATSSILGRSWVHWNRRMHHILDPVTCRPAPEIWRTASVAAPSCVIANTFTTAALVRGRAAVGLLRRSGAPARLVAADGSVTVLNGWPTP